MVPSGGITPEHAVITIMEDTRDGSFLSRRNFCPHQPKVSQAKVLHGEPSFGRNEDSS